MPIIGEHAFHNTIIAGDEDFYSRWTILMDEYREGWAGRSAFVKVSLSYIDVGYDGGAANAAIDSFTTRTPDGTIVFSGPGWIPRPRLFRTNLSTVTIGCGVYRSRATVLTSIQYWEVE